MAPLDRLTTLVLALALTSVPATALAATNVVATAPATARTAADDPGDGTTDGTTDDTTTDDADDDATDQSGYDDDSVDPDDVAEEAAADAATAEDPALSTDASDDDEGDDTGAPGVSPTTGKDGRRVVSIEDLLRTGRLNLSAVSIAGAGSVTQKLSFKSVSASKAKHAHKPSPWASGHRSVVRAGSFQVPLKLSEAGRKGLHQAGHELKAVLTTTVTLKSGKSRTTTTTLVLRRTKTTRATPAG